MAERQPHDKPRFRFHLPIGSFRRLQRHEQRFVETVGLQETAPKIMGMMEGEMEELRESVASGDRKEVMCEVADIAMLLSRLAEVHNFSLKDAINGKVERNKDKYPPRKLRRLQRDWGMTADQAMAFAKQNWDRDRDRGYF